MKNLKALNVVSTEAWDIVGADVILARTDTNRYYLADSLTGDLLTSGFTSEKLALDKLARIEDRRVKGNLMGYRFGSKITGATLRDYTARVWGDLYTLSETRFDGHYWWAKVEDADGNVSELVRADYFINYLRIPAGMESPEAIEVAVARGARWDD